MSDLPLARSSSISARGFAFRLPQYDCTRSLGSHQTVEDATVAGDDLVSGVREPAWCPIVRETPKRF
jgi:hypothetical protein